MHSGHVLAALAALCLAAKPADVEVVKPGHVKSTLDLKDLRCGGEAGARFASVLQNDLDRSGWFVLEPGQGAVRVQGVFAAETDGLRVTYEVQNRSNGRLYLRRADSRSDGDVRRLAHRVADEIVAAVKGVPGIASTRIAMVGLRAGAKDIYLCDADGAGLVRVTREGAPCLSPAWSPDARRLVYTGFLRGFPDVYAIDMQSFARESIAAFPGLNAGADISPDGREIVLTLSKDGNPDLYILRSGSRQLSRLTRTPHAAEASPSWDREGRRMVYVSDASGSPQLYAVSRSGAWQKRISFRGSENVAPDWGPGGLIAYCSRRGGRYRICVIDIDTGVDKELSNDAADYEDPSWAPDGRHIVCARSVGYHSELYVLDLLGDPPVRLTSVEGEWYSPSWSPK